MAFHCTEQKLLLKKLHTHSIKSTGITLELIKSYLTNRKQQVQINHTEGKQQIQNYSNSTVLRLVPYSSYYLPRVNNGSTNNISILNVGKYLDEL
jgi:hypothetical protein